MDSLYFNKFLMNNTELLFDEQMSTWNKYNAYYVLYRTVKKNIQVEKLMNQMNE